MEFMSSTRFSNVAPPVLMPQHRTGLKGSRFALPIDPELTASSPFELAELLGKLRRVPEAREELIREAKNKRTGRGYLSRQSAEQTAGVILRVSSIPFHDFDRGPATKGRG